MKIVYEHRLRKFLSRFEWCVGAAQRFWFSCGTNFGHVSFSKILRMPHVCPIFTKKIYLLSKSVISDTISAAKSMISFDLSWRKLDQPNTIADPILNNMFHKENADSLSPANSREYIAENKIKHWEYHRFPGLIRRKTGALDLLRGKSSRVRWVQTPTIGIP